MECIFLSNDLYHQTRRTKYQNAVISEGQYVTKHGGHCLLVGLSMFWNIICINLESAAHLTLLQRGYNSYTIKFCLRSQHFAQADTSLYFSIMSLHLYNHMLTECFSDEVKLVNIRSTRPQWLTTNQLSEYTANSPDINRRPVLCIPY